MRQKCDWQTYATLDRLLCVWITYIINTATPHHWLYSHLKCNHTYNTIFIPAQKHLQIPVQKLVLNYKNRFFYLCSVHCALTLYDLVACQPMAVLRRRLEWQLWGRFPTCNRGHCNRCCPWPRDRKPLPQPHSAQLSEAMDTQKM